MDEYSVDYFKLIKEVQKNGHKLRISTITIVCDLNIKTLDLSLLNEYIINEISFVSTKHSKDHNECIISKRGKVKKTFFNQLTINYEDVSKKSIKIFLNGKIQITGLTSMIESKYVIRMISKWISKCMGDENVYIENFKIGMINSNFTINKGIYLEKLQSELIRSCKHVYSRYEPDTYPAINVKNIFDNKVSVFIFGSGNIVITGAKTLKEIKESYIFINNFISYKDYLLKHIIPTNKITKTQVYIDGYPIKEYISCLK